MKKSTIIIIILVIAAACAAYFYFEGGSSSSQSTLTSQGAPTGAVVGSQVLGLLNQIQSLQINNSLFSDPAYLTLQDYSVPIPQENVGRTNPFAPIPGVSLPTTPGTSQ